MKTGSQEGMKSGSQEYMKSCSALPVFLYSGIHVFYSLKKFSASRLEG